MDLLFLESLFAGSGGEPQLRVCPLSGGGGNTATGVPSVWEGIATCVPSVWASGETIATCVPFT